MGKLVSVNVRGVKDGDFNFQNYKATVAEAINTTDIIRAVPSVSKMNNIVDGNVSAMILLRGVNKEVRLYTTLTVAQVAALDD